MIKLLTHLTTLRGSLNIKLLHCDCNIHFHLTYFPDSSDSHFIALYTVDKWFWTGLCFEKFWWNSCLVFVFATLKRRTSGKCKQAPTLLTHLRSESESMNGIVAFGNEMYLLYGQQASLCSIISKLSRKGCCLFVFFLPKCFPRCQADSQ